MFGKKLSKCLIFDTIYCMKTDYLPRLIDKKIQKYLNAFGAVYIKGPRWCGKTTTCSQFAKSKVFVDGNLKSKYENMQTSNYQTLLEGDKPRLIDEWQTIPYLWDAIRRECDELGNSKGLFLLTGSSHVEKNKITHSGIGRIGTITMNTMSLYESKESTGVISLESLKSNPIVDVIDSEHTLESIANIICRGGWPSSISLNDDELALTVPRDYVAKICEDDLINSKYKLNSSKFKKLLHSYARNVATLCTDTTMIEDIKEGDQKISINTFKKYMQQLHDLMIIDEIEPFTFHARSRVLITAQKKRNFTDPSLGCAILKLKPNDFFINKMNFGLFGFYFESLALRDLKIYAESIGASIYYYRDNKGYEVDAILEFDNNDYALVEIKLSAIDSSIAEATKNMDVVAKVIEQDRKKPPVFKMILTAVGYSKTLSDGTIIVPIGLLKN